MRVLDRDFVSVRPTNWMLVHEVYAFFFFLQGCTQVRPRCRLVSVCLMSGVRVCSYVFFFLLFFSLYAGFDHVVVSGACACMSYGERCVRSQNVLVQYSMLV